MTAHGSAARHVFPDDPEPDRVDWETLEQLERLAEMVRRTPVVPGR